jgi:catechol 2,3-dioxygenase-like lactoylglutathione lyase family enzyme
MNLVVHHIGCVVSSIEESLETYKSTLGFSNCSEVFFVSSQAVKVCFLEIGRGTYLELVEPMDQNSAVAKLLKKRHSYYHVGYKTSNFKKDVNDLERKGAKLITRFKSEAFNNKECAFYYTEELHMIELIEV